MPQNLNFRLCRGHWFFFKKMEDTVIAPNHSGDILGSISGRMGSYWVQKNGSKPQKITMPQNSNFRLPRGHWFFFKKMEVTVIAPNHSGDPLGSILGPNGSHWVQKMGQNRLKLPCPKIRIFDYPTVIDFSQQVEVAVMAPNHGGDALGSILGPMGPYWVQKLAKTIKKYYAPKFKFSTTLRSSIFRKNRNHGCGAKSRWGPFRVDLGANGSQLVKKWNKTVKNYHAPKFEFSTTPLSSIFRKIWKLRLWRQIMVVTP